MGFGWTHFTLGLGLKGLIVVEFSRKCCPFNAEVTHYRLNTGMKVCRILKIPPHIPLIIMFGLLHQRLVFLCVLILCDLKGGQPG